MSSRRVRFRLLRVEPLESRCVLSLIIPADLDHHGDQANLGDWAALDSGPAKGGGGGPPAPAIRLDLVALHEFGHSLGLDHTSDTSSIMYPYYNANYNIANFANDSAVAILKSLYANVATSPWKDSLDPHPGNGKVDVTYSFVPDGARLDKAASTTFATFDTIFGAGNWQSIFAGELNRWAANSNGKLAFESHSDAGLSFNYSGAAQNDSASGDIRIGAHRFDGAGKVLAHTYFPPPNGGTAAGDAHFDQAEKWTLVAGSSIVGGSGVGGGSRGNLVVGGLVGAESAALLVTMETDNSAVEPITTVFAADLDSSPQVHDVRSIGAVALVNTSVQTQSATDSDDLANTLSGDDGDLMAGDGADLAWLDALAWQRIEFGQAAR